MVFGTAEGPALGLGTHSEVRGPNADPARHMVGLATDDIQADWKRLQAAGVKFVEDPTDYGTLRIATLADPDGNLVQLFQPAQAAGGKGEAFAKQIEAKAKEAAVALSKLSDADWKKVTEAEKWTVAATAHHLAGALNRVPSLVTGGRLRANAGRLHPRPARRDERPAREGVRRAAARRRRARSSRRARRRQPRRCAA